MHVVMWCCVASVIRDPMMMHEGRMQHFTRGFRPSMEYHGNPSLKVAPRPDYRRFSLYLEPGSSRSNSWNTDTTQDVDSLPKSRIEAHHARPPPHPESRVSCDYLNTPYRMTDSLTEIQSDIQRLNQQQHQIQTMMHNGVQNSQLPPNTHPHLPQQQLNQFYLHEQVGHLIL